MYENLRMKLQIQKDLNGQFTENVDGGYRSIIRGHTKD